jgi:hypothetical protein
LRQGYPSAGGRTTKVMGKVKGAKGEPANKGKGAPANKGKGKAQGKETDWWGSMNTELHWVMKDRARTVEPMPPSHRKPRTTCPNHTTPAQPSP